MAVALLVASLGLIGFCYAGYPLLMALLARWRPRPIRAGNWSPAVDVVVVAHDAGGAITSRIDNLLDLDYPTDRLRIRIGCDGCGDDTAARARQHVAAHGVGDRIDVVAFPERRGKSACLGDLVAPSRADVVLFCDVRQRIEPGALRALVAPLADPAVGAVSGELMFESIEGFGGSVDAYWRYEKFIRRNESSSGSVVGVTGALWVARRSVLPVIPAGLVLDDVWTPLAIARGGFRVLFCGDAVAWDRPSRDASQEEMRKRRTLAGNFQLIGREPALLWPPAHPLGWRLWGHKWLRLAAPWLFVVALLANVALVGDGGAYAMLLAAQLSGWLLAALGIALPALQRLLPVRIAALFARMNLYAALALFDYLRDRNAHLWTRGTQEASR